MNDIIILNEEFWSWKNNLIDYLGEQQSKLER